MALSGRGRHVLRTGGDGRCGPRWLLLAQAGSWGCMEGCPLCPWALPPAGGQQGVVGGSPHCPWERGATCRPGDRGSHSQAGRGEGWPEPSQEGTPLRTGETRLGGQTLEGQEPWGPR